MEIGQVFSALQKHRGNPRNPSLEPMRRLLSRLGDPQDRVPCIHVAGTNGKGSVCAMLAAVLQACGYCTGLFLSPYVVEFGERIQINGRYIPSERLADIAGKVFPQVEVLEAQGDSFTEFELVAALGFLYFWQEGCEIAVIETGMGGRIDATNVLARPELAVLTAVSFDHTAVLGSSLAAIAREKSGILKPGVDMAVSFPQPSEVWPVLEQAAKATDSRLWDAGEIRLEDVSDSLDGIRWQVQGRRFRLPLAGPHQIENLRTVWKALQILRGRGWDLPWPAVQEGFSRARLPARLERFGTMPLFLLDCAHNPAGAEVLAESVRRYLPGRRVAGVVGMLRDKPCAAVMDILSPCFSDLFAVTPDSPRALPDRELAAFWRGETPPHLCGGNLAGALRQAAACVGETGAVVVCGSLFLAGQARPLLWEQEKFAEKITGRHAATK